MKDKTQQLTEYLIQLGFSASQSKSYCWCLKEAENQGGIICLPRDSQVDFHNDLIRLQRLGFLFLYKNGGGDELVRLIDPRIATRANFTQCLWEVCYTEDDLPNLPLEQQELLTFRKDLCSLIEMEITQNFTPMVWIGTSSGDSSEMIRMIPRETVSEELAVHILNAKNIIRGITAPNWAPGLPLVWEAIKDRRSVGVTYRRIADEITFASFGLVINRRDVEQIGIDLRITSRELLTEKFFVIDDSAVFMFWDTATDNSFPLKASLTSMPTFVKNSASSFDNLWNISTPAEILFSEFENFRESFVPTCRSLFGCRKGEELANGLVDYGRFFIEGNEWNEELDVLLEKGLIQTYSEHRKTIIIPSLVKIIVDYCAQVNPPEE